MPGGTLAEPMVARKNDLRLAVKLVNAIPDMPKGAAMDGIETIVSDRACDQFYMPAAAAAACRGAFNDALSAC